MRAEAAPPEVVGRVEVLVHPQKPSLLDLLLHPKFGERNPAEGGGQRLVLRDAASRDKETTFGRLVSATPYEHAPLGRSNDQVNRHQRRQPDNVLEISRQIGR